MPNTSYLKGKINDLKKYFNKNIDIIWVRGIHISNMLRVLSKIFIFIRNMVKYYDLYLPFLFKMFLRKKVPVIYIMGDAFEALTAIPMAILISPRLVIGLHNPSPNHRSFIVLLPILRLMSILRILRGIHCVNVLDAIILRKYLRGVNVFYLPNGVDTSRFKPSLKNNMFQVIFVGALHYGKGIDVFLKAIEYIISNNLCQKCVFKIASIGGPLEDLIREYAQKGYVDYLGYVEDSKLVEELARSHVAVFPSREEAFGLVVLEAMASGTPVITTNIVAFKQTNKENVTGFFVRVDDPIDLANAIIKVYNLWKYQSERYFEMCQNARLRAEEFSWNRIVKMLLTKISQ